ncbi:MAG: DUF2130 domain-containing protein [Bacilli bacterium]|nr:DUF2130 domain-containing protein [Bacilli bacterium]MDD4056539.1 DUF2130 domain-containing protein [Bacilli bacterium]MDY0208861.1 DUF2130 domain-containing protein [Bacilli bacterium]
MAKITNVIIIDSNTLQLNVDAQKGDVIDLLSLNQVDNSSLIKKILDNTDEEYQKRLQEVKEKLKVEKERDIAFQTEKLKEEITKYKRDLEHQKELLAKEKANEILLAVMKKEKELQANINQLQLSLQAKENEIILAVNQKEKELQKELNDQKEEISNLRLTKSLLSVKKIGEELENWCNNEYISYSQSGFYTSSWEKDNVSIKEEGEFRGTKADYIFKVYATEAKLENELLTSVVCEMKSEDPNSTNKKKNSDHYAKLDKDRKKKQCEYALLISELEWDQANDVPIRRIEGYEKMYMVRPQYFMTFLSIIMALSLKYKELLLRTIEEAEQFKDSQAIIDEFEKMKKEIFDKPLDKLEKQIKEIANNANIIIKSAEKIITSSEVLTSSVLETIKSKIENFNITKVVNKMNKMSKENE